MTNYYTLLGRLFNSPAYRREQSDYCRNNIEWRLKTVLIRRFKEWANA